MLGVSVVGAITHQSPDQLRYEPSTRIRALSARGLRRHLVRGRLTSAAPHEPADRDSATRTGQSGRARASTGLGLGECRLYDPVLAGVISDRSRTVPSGRSAEIASGKHVFELLELLVDCNSQVPGRPVSRDDHVVCSAAGVAALTTSASWPVVEYGRPATIFLARREAILPFAVCDEHLGKRPRQAGC